MFTIEGIKPEVFVVFAQEKSGKVFDKSRTALLVPEYAMLLGIIYCFFLALCLQHDGRLMSQRSCVGFLHGNMESTHGH